MNKIYETAFAYGLGKSGKFVHPTSWAIATHYAPNVLAAKGAELTPNQIAMITDDFSVMMAMGARLKRNQYILTGTVLGAVASAAICVYTVKWLRKQKK